MTESELRAQAERDAAILRPKWRKYSARRAEILMDRSDTLAAAAAVLDAQGDTCGAITLLRLAREQQGHLRRLHEASLRRTQRTLARLTIRA